MGSRVFVLFDSAAFAQVANMRTPLLVVRGTSDSAVAEPVDALTIPMLRLLHTGRALPAHDPDPSRCRSIISRRWWRQAHKRASFAAAREEAPIVAYSAYPAGISRWQRLQYCAWTSTCSAHHGQGLSRRDARGANNGEFIPSA